MSDTSAKDVYALKDVVTTEFNIEGYHPVIFETDSEIKPAQANFGSSGCIDFQCRLGYGSASIVFDRCCGRTEKLRSQDFSFSCSHRTNGGLCRGNRKWQESNCIQNILHEWISQSSHKSSEWICSGSERAAKVGLGLNAGHDLNLNNLRYFQTEVPGLLEVSIGHALISDALYFGLEEYRSRCICVVWRNNFVSISLQVEWNYIIKTGEGMPLFYPPRIIWIGR